MIYNAVTMTIKAGMMENFLIEAKNIRNKVLTEKGCLMYDYTREIKSDDARQETVNENRITLYEKWKTSEDLDIHSASEHMKAFIKKILPMRESVSIRTGTEAV